jgi:hypothetical protein
MLQAYRDDTFINQTRLFHLNYFVEHPLRTRHHQFVWALESPSIQLPTPHVERIRQNAPAEFFNRLVGSCCVVEESNDCDNDLDFVSVSNDFQDNDLVQQPYLDVPDPSIENADKIGDGNATFPDNTIMDEEHKKSGKAFDVS